MMVRGEDKCDKRKVKSIPLLSLVSCLLSADETGFTFIELIMTTLVAAIAIIAIGTLYSTVITSNRSAQSQTIATQAAQQEMEVVRNTPYANLTVGTTNLTSNLSADPLLPSPRSEQLVVSQYNANGLKQVDITVTYTSGSTTKTVKLTTLVALNGINQ